MLCLFRFQNHTYKTHIQFISLCMSLRKLIGAIHGYSSMIAKVKWNIWAYGMF